MNKIKVMIFGLALALLILPFSACETERPLQRGPVGVVPGALADRNDTWRGGAIGAPLGTAIKGRTLEISAKAVSQAALEGRPIAYLSVDGTQRVEAYPKSKGSLPGCHLVRQRIFQDGVLVGDEIKEACP
jgi:hypothetical protein